MASTPRLIEELSRIFPPDRLLCEPEALEEQSWDALTPGRLDPEREFRTSLPQAVVLPVSTAEVQELVRFANAAGIPLVPYGGGSGLMGGAISLAPAVVVDLKKMDRILEIDRAKRWVKAQAGIVLEALEKGLNREELILGHDPWTLPVATLGGAISTDSLGYRGGKYGSMGQQVLGLEVVLPDGEILETRPVPKSSAGIDLDHLFIGGEGCFGIITAGTVKVFPLPEERWLGAFRFPSFEDGFARIQQLFARGLAPALLDFGDNAQAGLGAVLYLAFEGKREIVEAEKRLALSLCEESSTRLPTEEAERFWRERHAIARRFMHRRRARREQGEPGLFRDWLHVALPASRVLEFRRLACTLVKQKGLVVEETGLWTQPELFSLRLSAEGGASAQHRLQETVAELLARVQQMNGSMEYCHGVGVKLAPFMAAEHGSGLELMRRIKRVMDPNGIMNPGKMGLC